MNMKAAGEIVFWLGAAALFYTYVGYPILIAAVSSLRPRDVKRGESLPQRSVTTTVFNEERALGAKLENTLALDYPRDLLEVIVASDCSTDRTDQIANEFALRGVKLHRQAERLGKTAAQNSAIEKAQGEVVVFSDATSHYQPNVLKMIVPNFADAQVGCVGGRLIYVDHQQSDIGRGAKSYWGYETFLKRHESRACSLIGVSGCLYAVRRSAYVPLENDACSDFIIATKMVEQGLRAVFEPNAICTEETNQRPANEMKMRVRVIAQTFSDLRRNRTMMNPFRSGLYAWELFSHKVMRYFAPFFLLALLGASATLSFDSPLYRIVLLLQMLGYSCAVVSWLLEKSGVRSRVLALPHYFLLANVASVIALFQFLRGERYARWQPIR